MSLADIITTLDAHAGAVTGIATVALVGATIILAYFNLKMWQSQDQPRLYFSTKVENKRAPTPTGKKITIGRHEVDVVQTGDYVLYVKNIGKGPAFEIHFEIPGLVDNFYGDCLMPAEEWQIAVLPGCQYEVTGLVYTDINGRKIKHKPILDLVTRTRMGLV